MNEVGDVVDPASWATQERFPMERKWVALTHRRTGARPPGGDSTLIAVRRLTNDRNLVAHFRGLKQPDGSYAVSGPPVEHRGGISPVRAYFDADRAQAAVDDAQAAFKML